MIGEENSEILSIASGFLYSLERIRQECGFGWLKQLYNCVQEISGVGRTINYKLNLFSPRLVYTIGRSGFSHEKKYPEAVTKAQELRLMGAKNDFLN